MKLGLYVLVLMLVPFYLHAGECNFDDVYDLDINNFVDTSCCDNIANYDRSLQVEEDLQEAKSNTTDYHAWLEKQLDDAIRCVLKKVSPTDYDKYVQLKKDQNSLSDKAKKEKEQLDILEKNEKIIAPDRAAELLMENEAILLKKKIIGDAELARIKSDINHYGTLLSQAQNILNEQKEHQEQTCKDQKAVEAIADQKKHTSTAGLSAVAQVRAEKLRNHIASAIKYPDNGFEMVWGRAKKAYTNKKETTNGMNPNLIKYEDYIRSVRFTCQIDNKFKPNLDVQNTQVTISSIQSEIDKKRSCAAMVVKLRDNRTTANLDDLQDTECKSQFDRFIKSYQEKTTAPKLMSPDEIEAKAKKYTSMVKEIQDYGLQSQAKSKEISDLIDAHLEDLIKDEKCGYDKASKAVELDGDSSPDSVNIDSKDKLRKLSRIRSKLNRLKKKCGDDDYCEDCDTNSKRKGIGSTLKGADGLKIIINNNPSNTNNMNSNNPVNSNNKETNNATIDNR